MRSFVVVLVGVLAGCGGEGPRGEMGPRGAAGIPGEPGTPGAPGERGEAGEPAPAHEIAGVGTQGGVPVPEGTLVTLNLLDGYGASSAIAATLADAEGRFSITVDDGLRPSSRLAVIASTRDRDLVAPVSRTGGIVVDEVSSALMNIVRRVASTEPRTLDDFSAAELDAMIERLREPGSIYPDDPGALEPYVARRIGDLLVEAAGANVALELVQRQAPGGARPLPPYLYDGHGFAWIPADDCGFEDAYGHGFSGAFAPMFELTVDGVPYEGGSRSLLGGSVVACSQAPIGDVLVRRRAAVLKKLPFARIVDEIENPTDRYVEVSLRVGGHTGSRLVAGGGEDDLLTADDGWFATVGEDETAPLGAFWFGPGVSSVYLDGGDVSWTRTIEVPAGSRRTIVYLASVAERELDAEELARRMEIPFAASELWAGAAPDEVRDVANLELPFTGSTAVEITGEAGSVTPFAEVVVHHADAPEMAVRTVAWDDGSFELGVMADPGARLILTDGAVQRELVVVDAVDPG